MDEPSNETQRNPCETAVKDTNSGSVVNSQNRSYGQGAWEHIMHQEQPLKIQNVYSLGTESVTMVTSGDSRVLVELQEARYNASGSMTSLKLEMSQEMKDTEADEAQREMPSGHISERSSVNDKESKEKSIIVMSQTAVSNSRKKHVLERCNNLRTRSHNVKKTCVNSDRKYSTRNKVHVSDESVWENDADERFTEATEPEVTIQCKAKYIKLKPISKSDLEGKDLFVEIEIDKDLIVSPLEKFDSSTGRKSKYTFKVSPLREDKIMKRKPHSSTNTSDNDISKVKKWLTKRKKEKQSESVGERGILENNEKKIKLADQQTSLHLSEISLEPSDEAAAFGALTDTEPDNTNLNELNTCINDNHRPVDTIETNLAKKVKKTMKKKVKAKVKTDLKTEPKIDVKTEPRIDETKIQNVSKKKPRKKVVGREKKPAKSVEYSTRITEEGVKLYGCPLCKYESRFSQNIRSHHQIHMNVKPWICDVCGSAFVSKCNLRHHMVSHSTDRPFKCSICGVGFKQKVVLQQHVARHNEDRQFVCDHCGKGFCISGDLKKHIRTHTGEKPYTCEVCFKQFSDNSSLARHRYLHNEEKNFGCDKCGKKFARRDMCNSHMKTHCNDGETSVKPKKRTVKRTKKDESEVGVEPVKSQTENRNVPPREHLYHIEHYAKEIQERTYTDMDVARAFTVNNYPQQQQQQQQSQQQTVQVYTHRAEPSIQQETYPRDYTSMWPNLHFY